MSQVTAGSVKALREKTGLPMMDCKKALAENGGDEEAAIRWLREKGKAKFTERSDRETAFGRMGIYPTNATGPELKQPGAMVELKCESAPVAGSEEFIQLADDLAQVLATTEGITTADELLALPSPSKAGMTLGEVKDDMFNRIREVFNVARMVRFEGACGSYSHNAATVAGVLLEVEGENAELAKDISMHVAAMKPQALSPDELDAEVVAKEREIYAAAAREEGKPEQIIDKIVDGKMRAFYAESVLLEQQYVKAEGKETVGQAAKKGGLTLKRFAHWVLGEG